MHGFKRRGHEEANVSVEAIQRKLDTDFFSARWVSATERQQQLLWVIANLDNADDEFTISEIVELAKSRLEKRVFNKSRQPDVMFPGRSRPHIQASLRAIFVRRTADGTVHPKELRRSDRGVGTS